MRHVDPELGQPLPEKSYGGNCRIYDKDKPDDPFHNFWVPMSDYNIYLILTFDIWSVYVFFWQFVNLTWRCQIYCDGIYWGETIHDRYDRL